MHTKTQPQYVMLKRPTDTNFTCLFCHHDKSVSVRINRKEGMAQLLCKVCDQRYQSKANREFFLVQNLALPDYGG